MKLKCECCGFEEEFPECGQAFERGWDAEPHFTGYVCCNLCPGSFVVLGITDQHAAMHEHWKLHGRPSKRI